MRRSDLSKPTFLGLALPYCVIALALGCGGSGADSNNSTGTSSSTTASTIDGGFIDAGITDEQAACVMRHTWQHSGSGNCSYCTGLAEEAPCTCTSDPAVAKCHAEVDAVNANADCTSALKTCLISCSASTDCTCENSCFQGHDSCRVTEGALSGCLINICTSRCE